MHKGTVSRMRKICADGTYFLTNLHTCSYQCSLSNFTPIPHHHHHVFNIILFCHFVPFDSVTGQFIIISVILKVSLMRWQMIDILDGK